MKKLLNLLPLVSIVLTGCNDKNKYLIKSGDADVILIFGQSNASGNSPYEYLETKDNETYSVFNKGTNNVLVSWNVVTYNNKFFEPCHFGMADANNFFGPEIGIADVFRKENKTTYIIKFAFGGSTLHDQWLDGNENRGDLYNGSVNWVKEKINYLRRNNVTPHVKAIFWMQGESDSLSEHYDKYEANLSKLIRFYRDDLKSYYKDHLPFIDAYISTKTLWKCANAINKSKQNIADSNPYNFVIKTNGEDETALNLNLKKESNEGNDTAHYDSLSELTLGREIAKLIKSI